MEVVVYRYGHRIGRDKRITTHVALVARAFGANGIVIDEKDERVENSIKDVVERFGGDFLIETGIPWREYFKKWDGKIAHLTMYGERVDEIIEDVRKNDKLLVIVGSEKVPGEFYRIADYNIAIGNQPHSEVSALAIFMHFLTDGGWLRKKFDGIIEIVPCKRGKKIKYNYIRMLRQVGCDERVIEHCIKVRNLAIEIAKAIEKNGYRVDMEAIEAGAMLHDIGRAKTHGIMHIVEGVKIAKKYGLPKKVIDIIEHHGGAGIDVMEAKKLGLPEKDYTPRSIEEKIVAHADNLAGNGYRNVKHLAKIWEKRIGKKAAEKLIKLHEQLSKLAGIDIDEIVERVKKG